MTESRYRPNYNLTGHEMNGRTQDGYAQCVNCKAHENQSAITQQCPHSFGGRTIEALTARIAKMEEAIRSASNCLFDSLDLQPVQVKEGRPFQFTFNGRNAQTTTNFVRYEDVVERYRAGRNLPVGIVLTVTYSDGPASNPTGSLTKGEQVEVCDGMIFNAAITG